MIEIKIIDRDNSRDINLPNEPFSEFGRVLVTYREGRWSYEISCYEDDKIISVCFPDEHYDPAAMSDSVFIGAYDGDVCVGLAVLQPGFLKYAYLSDLKVSAGYRRRNIGRLLIERAGKLSKDMGFLGLYAYVQDNNPGAFMFYLNSGFYIGGLDTNLYRHTKQEGKSDIIVYCEC